MASSSSSAQPPPPPPPPPPFASFLRKRLARLNPFDLRRDGPHRCKCDSYEPPGSPPSTLDDRRYQGDIHLRGYPICDFAGGQCSYAYAKGLNLYEDRYTVASDVPGNGGLLAAVYDGHGGMKAAEHLESTLLTSFIQAFADIGDVNQQLFCDAISNTANSFDKSTESAGGSGSCCLIGLIWEGHVTVANLGDSKAILGQYNLANKIFGKQVAKDSKATGLWSFRAKNERSIGGVKSEMKCLVPEFYKKQIKEEDKFLILGSSGLWKLMSIEEAVKIIHRNTRKGSAKRLVVEALLKAEKKKDKAYEKWQGIVDRRKYHDDMTVVVIFLGHGPPIPKIPLIPVKNFNTRKDGPAIMKQFCDDFEKLRRGLQGRRNSWPYTEKGSPVLRRVYSCPALIRAPRDSTG